MEEIIKLLKEIRDKLENRQVRFKQFYSTDDFANLPGVHLSSFSTRQHCLNGRIKAKKARSGRGLHGAWQIPHESYEYYVNHGLLPPDGEEN